MRIWYDGDGTWLIEPNGEDDQEECQAVSAFFEEAKRQGEGVEIEYIAVPASLKIGDVRLLLGNSPDWCKEAIDMLKDSHDLTFRGHMGALPPHGSIMVEIRGHRSQFPLVL